MTDRTRQLGFAEAPQNTKGGDHRQGHRHRLRVRFLADGGRSMPDYEILELLLFYAVQRKDTKALAKSLLARFGSLGAVLSAEPEQLVGVKEMSERSMVLLKATREVGLRLTRAEAMAGPVLGSWDKVLAYCRARLAHERTERFHLLFLDRKNRLIADQAQQEGTVDHTPIYPREVVKAALEMGACALILVHNHPSGDPSPSQQDIETTRAVIAAAKPLGIDVHDHIVVDKQGHASLRSLGLI